MITRRQGREWALQLLVQFDLNPPASVDAGIEAFWEQQAQLELDALAEEPGSVKAVFTDPNPQTGEKLHARRVRHIRNSPRLCRSKPT